MNNVYQIITDRIIDRLSKGDIPWKQPFRSAGQPRSMSTGRVYNGINWLLLSSLGYTSPHFITFKQALDMGGNVKKGEKGFPVVFWKQWAPTAARTEGTSDDATPGKKIPLLRYYTVFNVTQCEGLEGKLPETAAAAQAQKAADYIRGISHNPADIITEPIAMAA